MLRGLVFFLTLAAGLPAAVRADPGPPPPEIPPPMVTPIPWSAEGAIRDGSATCGECRATTVRFLVGLERHHGFYLMREGNRDSTVLVVFANPQARARFDRYLAPGNMPSLYGKRIYCDCTGVSYNRGAIFRIAEARLFAR